MPFDVSEMTDSWRLRIYQDNIYLRDKEEREEAVQRHSEHLSQTGQSTRDEFLRKIWGGEKTAPQDASDEYRQIAELLEELDELMDAPVSQDNLQSVQQTMLQRYSILMYCCDKYLKKRGGYRFTRQGKNRQQLVQDLRRQLEDEALTLQKGLEEMPMDGRNRTLRDMLPGTQPSVRAQAQARDFSLPASQEEQAEEQTLQAAEKTAQASAQAGGSAAEKAGEKSASKEQQDADAVKKEAADTLDRAVKLSDKKYKAKATGKSGEAIAAAIAAAKAAMEAAEKALGAAKAALQVAESTLEEEEQGEAKPAGGKKAEEKPSAPEKTEEQAPAPKADEQAPAPQTAQKVAEPEKAGEQQADELEGVAALFAEPEGSLADLRAQRRRLRADKTVDPDRKNTIQILLEQADRAIQHGQRELCADLIDRVIELCANEKEDGTLGGMARVCRAFKENSSLQNSSEDETYESGLTFSQRALAEGAQPDDMFPEYSHLDDETVQDMLLHAVETTGGNVEGPVGTIQIRRDVLNQANLILRMQQTLLDEARKQEERQSAMQQQIEQVWQPKPKQPDQAKNEYEGLSEMFAEPAPEARQSDLSEDAYEGLAELFAEPTLEEQELADLELQAERELQEEARARSQQQAAAQQPKKSGFFSWVRGKISGRFRRKKEPSAEVRQQLAGAVKTPEQGDAAGQPVSMQQLLADANKTLAEVRDEGLLTPIEQLEVEEQRERQASGSMQAGQLPWNRPFRYSDAEYRRALETAELIEQVSDQTRLPDKTRLHRITEATYLTSVLGIELGRGGTLPKGVMRKINGQAGRIVQENGFLRTMYAAAPTNARQPVMLTLLCDEGTPVLSAGNGEMLLGQGTSYMILGAVAHGRSSTRKLPTVQRAVSANSTEEPPRSAAFQGIEIFVKVAAQNRPRRGRARLAPMPKPAPRRPAAAPVSAQPVAPVAAMPSASKATAASPTPVQAPPKTPQAPPAPVQAPPQPVAQPAAPKPARTAEQMLRLQKMKQQRMQRFGRMLILRNQYDTSRQPAWYQKQYLEAFQHITTGKTNNHAMDLPMEMDTFRSITDDYLADLLQQIDKQLPDDAKGQAVLDGKVNHAWLAEPENREKLKGKVIFEERVVRTLPSRRQALLEAQSRQTAPKAGEQQAGGQQDKQMAPGKHPFAVPGGTHLIKMHLPKGQQAYMYTDPSKPIYGLFLPRQRPFRIEDIRKLGDGQYEIHLSCQG